MRVSLGHTNASAEVLRQAVAAGATGFTHFGNACPQELDRHDNILWRALDTPGLTAGLIPDGIHVSPVLFRLVHRLFDPDGLTLDRRTPSPPRARLPAATPLADTRWMLAWIKSSGGLGNPTTPVPACGRWTASSGPPGCRATVAGGVGLLFPVQPARFMELRQGSRSADPSRLLPRAGR